MAAKSSHLLRIGRDKMIKIMMSYLNIVRDIDKNITLRFYCSF